MGTYFKKIPYLIRVFYEKSKNTYGTNTYLTYPVRKYNLAVTSAAANKASVLKH
jgi:hypothetical protein